MSDVQRTVQQKYGAIAAAVSESGSAARARCCATSACGCGPSALVGAPDSISSNLYPEAQIGGLPVDAIAASLGCGNPTALVHLEPGQVVLDLGSGGGIDVLLSARLVGPSGKVYGLDMTDEMLALARRNQRQAGADNVEFLKGTIEAIPLPDASVDVVISNCVINLSTDKDAVLREAFRVLKPGGRFAVADLVVRGEVPPAIRRSAELWVGCVAGALHETEYAAKLAAAGFVDVGVEVWRVYRADDMVPFLADAGIDVERVAPQIDGRFASAFIRARKPQTASCCAPECCR